MSPCFNQLQVLGTHNSYHTLAPEPILKLLDSSLAKALLPPEAFLPQAWEYQHWALAQQLDAGIRSFELDVHPDPEGGLYSAPAFLKLAGADVQLSDPAYQQPGYKVLHTPDIDVGTNCVTLVECLKAVRTWSQANPSHVPITIVLETSFGETDLIEAVGDSAKTLINGQLAASAGGPQALIVPPQETPDLLGSLEAEILSAFPSEAIITPDSVRTALNLAPSVNLSQHLLQPPSATSCPWPDLETLRGKVMFGFILPSEGAVAAYKSLHPEQKGAVGWFVWDSFPVDDAVMFSSGNINLSSEGGAVPPEIPGDAASIVSRLAKEVADKAGQGYLVRARADVDTVEARNNYAARAEAMLKSPASIISTDFPNASSTFDSTYSVKLPGGQPARCIEGVDLGYAGAEVSCGTAPAAESPAAAVPAQPGAAPPTQPIEKEDASPASGPVAAVAPSISAGDNGRSLPTDSVAAVPGSNAGDIPPPPASDGPRNQATLLTSLVLLGCLIIAI